MDTQNIAPFTPFNYFGWKKQMEIHLKHKGSYRVTMGTKIKPTGVAKKRKWFNRCDEAYGTLSLSLYSDLHFHNDSCTTPHEVWTTL